MVNITIENKYKNITKSVSINNEGMKNASFAFPKNVTYKFGILLNNSEIVIISFRHGTANPTEYWMCRNGTHMKWTKAYSCYSKFAWCKNNRVRWIWRSNFTSQIRCRRFNGKSFQNREQFTVIPFSCTVYTMNSLLKTSQSEKENVFRVFDFP